MRARGGLAVADRRAPSKAILGALLAAALTYAPPRAEADALRDACLGTNGQPPSSASITIAAKENFAPATM
jgi:hypothetical protein